MTDKKIEVRQGAEPVPAEVLAESIVAISRGVSALRAGRLNDRALVLLIASAASAPHAKVSQGTVRTVLDAIEAPRGGVCLKPAGRRRP